MVKLDKISFSYGEKEIFKDYSLSFDEKIVCFMGASGLGKTTLLRLLCGLEKVSSGKIEKDFTNPSVLFQEDRLLPWLNVRENVELVSKDTDKVLRLLKELEINPSLRIDELSGGMARRVALARALAYDSDVLILDEPLNGLDVELKEKVVQIILSEGKPILFTSHLEEEAALFGAKIIPLDL